MFELEELFVALLLLLLDFFCLLLDEDELDRGTGASGSSGRLERDD